MKISKLYNLRPTKLFICRANTDPPVTEIRLWVLLGCRSGLDRGPDKKLFFDNVDVIQTQKPAGKSSPSIRVHDRPRSQSIGRGRISREGALDVRESREYRDKFLAEKKKMPKF